MNVVIIANGDFPTHARPLKALHEADVLVSCDGSVDELIKHGLTPTAIVGDLDSLSTKHKHSFSNIIFHNPDQNCNDLTKAVNWCFERSYNAITIVGATGKREDHTLGNISLLVKYAQMGVNALMITNNGTLSAALKSTTFSSYRGQQISFFSPLNQTRVTTQNLKYPLNNAFLPNLWNGTLNESLGDSFGLVFEPGPLIVYQNF